MKAYNEYVNTHAVALSVGDMKSLWLALKVAVNKSKLEPETNQTWENLIARLDVIIPRCESLDEYRIRNKQMKRPPRPVALYFCSTENCPAPVSAAGELCRDCGGGGAA